MSKRTIAIFDFGGVLIDWDPRHLYRKIFGEDVAAMEHFLSNVCTPEWNLLSRRGTQFCRGDGGACLQISRKD
jgi:2-haloacid dehalogenase